jgi:ferredoxin-nitrate reductase
VEVDPRATATAEAADLHLRIRPGTDLALLHGLAHLLLRRMAIDFEFIEEQTEGFAALARLLQAWPPHRVAALCGIEQSQLEQLAQWWESAGGVLSPLVDGGEPERGGHRHRGGIINLHLLTGQIGRPGAGPFSLTGQPNAMGGREAGGLSHLLPGYRTVKNPEHRAEVERARGLPAGSIAAQPGLTAWQQVEAMERGELGLWWVAATNPLVSMPHLERVRAAMARCPLVVVSEAYAATETPTTPTCSFPPPSGARSRG